MCVLCYSSCSVETMFTSQVLLGVISIVLNFATTLAKQQHIYASISDLKQLQETVITTIPELDTLNVNNPVDAFGLLKTLLVDHKEILPSLEPNLRPTIEDLLGAANGLNLISDTYQMPLNKMQSFTSDQGCPGAFGELSQSDLSLLDQLKSFTTEHEMDNIMKPLCRKSLLKANVVSPPWKCHLKRKHLIPFKVEEVFDVPKVVLIRGFFSHQTLRQLKSMGESSEMVHMYKLYEHAFTEGHNNSTIISVYNKQLNITDNNLTRFQDNLHFGREGKMTFLGTTSKNEDILLNKLDSLLSTVLSTIMAHDVDLHQNASERLQMATYGIGGSISVHYDSYGQKDTPMEDSLDLTSENVRNSWHGDRLLTALGYIESTVGGATVFPYLDIAVAAQTGSLLVWQNLDYETLMPLSESQHGACPTICGPKWILNKWVRSYAQMFHTLP